MNTPARSPLGALTALSLCMLLASIGTSMANVALPTLAEVFGASFQAVQWVILAYLLALTALIVSVGRLGDLFGRRRLLLSGLAFFTGASALASLAPTLALLIAARALQGLGAAVLMALSMAMVGESVPKERTGRAMGLLGTMSSMGTALGPSLGGVLIAAFNWRALFVLNLPLGVITFLLASRHLPEDAAAGWRAQRFDHWGSALLVATLLFYCLAMTPRHGEFGGSNAVLLAVALLAGTWFVLVEQRVGSPLLELARLRDRTLCVGLARSLVVSTVIVATLVVGPFYLSRALGLNTAQVGLAISVGPVLAAFTGVSVGRWVDRLGAERLTAYGLAGVGAGCLVLALVPARFGVPAYLAGLAVVTIHYATFQAANNTAVMADIQATERGITSAMLNLSRSLGLVTGVAMMGAVFSIASGTHNVASARPEAVIAGMHSTFGVAALLVAGALLLPLLHRHARFRACERSVMPNRACRQQR